MKVFPLLFFAPFIMGIVGITIGHMIDDRADDSPLSMPNYLRTMSALGWASVSGRAPPRSRGQLWDG